MSHRNSRGGRGGRGPLPRNVQVSKKISWLLRHGAEFEGLTLGPGGYVNVQDALNTKTLRSLRVTFEELKDIVETNDKQRFSMVLITTDEPSSSDPASSSSSSTPADLPSTSPSISSSAPPTDTSDPSQYLIRANQGHSLAVATDGLLTPITLDTPLPSVVVHGTTHRAWPLIVRSGGLKRMGRTHVHFAAGLPKGLAPLREGSGGSATALDAQEAEAPVVISGMRASSAVLIYVDVRKALEEGLKFWRSENGVILSEGDEEGVVPVKFFEKVEERRSGAGVLMRDGVVVKELPEEVVRGGGGRGRGGKGGQKPRLKVEKDEAGVD